MEAGVGSNTESSPEEVDIRRRASSSSIHVGRSKSASKGSAASKNCQRANL